MQQGSGLFGQDAGDDFHLMVESGAGENFETGAEGAAFWIVCCVDEARNTGLDDCSSAHGARLEAYIQGCFRQTVICELLCGFAQDDDLGMSCWVAVADGAVAAAGQNLAAINQNGPNGDLAGLSAGTRFFECELHEFLVAHGFETEDITLSPALKGLLDCDGQLKGRILDIRALANETENMKEQIERLFQVNVSKRMAVTFRTEHSANPSTQHYPLKMNQDFQMAHQRREDAIWERQRLEEGPTPARCTR